MPLSTEQLAAYEANGYLVVEDVISAAEVAALRERVREYTHGGSSREGLYVQTERRVERGELAVAHSGDAIRKIDSLVQNDDLFQRLGLHENIVGIIAQIVGPDIKLFRNSLMLKP